MAQGLTFRAILALLAAFVCLLPLAIACGPVFPTATFVSAHPDLPLEGFAAGNLGVLLPEYSPSYLAVAYRYFENRPFSRDEQSQLVRAWDGQLYAHVDSYNAVLQASISRRNDVPTAPVYSVTGQGFQSFGNCLADAIETADRTRQERARQFGENSPAVASWAAAQKTVFDNCEGGSSVPDPADASLPQIIQKDRDYQIAAAYFYSLNFDEAKKRFLAIAGDRDSPWRATAALVAARCDIRWATVVNNEGAEARNERLATADGQLKAVIANPAFSSMKASAQRLRAFVGYRLDPDAQTNELANAIVSDTAPGAIGANLMDYNQLVFGRYPRSGTSAATQTNDLTDWIESFRYGGTADQQARRVTRWEETKSVAWLAAALVYAQPGAAKVEELLDAAAQVPTTSPAYLTVAFHANRLLARSDNLERVRSNIDQILKLPKGRLSPSSRNLFFALRMQAAKNLDDFLQFAPRQPLGVTLSLEVTDPQLCDHAPSECFPVNGPFFDSDAVVELTEAMPTSVLAQAAVDKRLPKALQAQIAETTWVRAILLDQDDLARKLVPVLSSLESDLASALKDYSNKPSAADRKFEAAFLILRQPGLEPYIHAGIGRFDYNKPTPDGEINNYRQNWWCSLAPGASTVMHLNFRSALGALYPKGNSVSPAFLTADERQSAASELAALQKIPAAPDWLAQQVLTWAQAHPDDSRLPEALHDVVVSSRYGCDDIDTATYSKQAFSLLHNRYSKSTWAAQTPYWFN